jgi:hypothetical protein
MPGCNGSFIMIIKLKPKYKFQTAAILFHILQKTDSAKNFIFFEDLLWQNSSTLE